MLLYRQSTVDEHVGVRTGRTGRTGRGDHSTAPPPDHLQGQCKRSRRQGAVAAAFSVTWLAETTERQGTPLPQDATSDRDREELTRFRELFYGCLTRRGPGRRLPALWTTC